MYPILNSEQIKAWDTHTIQEQAISGLELLERAASELSKAILNDLSEHHKFHVFCGSGNNGGDGMAVAILLSDLGKKVQVYLTESTQRSTENLILLERLKNYPSIQLNFNFPFPQFTHEDDVIVDALLGTGINRPLEGKMASLIDLINREKAFKVSLDIPSGMRLDAQNQESDCIFKPDIIYSIQSPKLPFFLKEYKKVVKKWVIINIGLSTSFIDNTKVFHYYISALSIAKWIDLPEKHDHKGDNGRLLMLAGSEGKYGAAFLALQSALRSGVGLITAQLPKTVAKTAHLSLPQVMFIPDNSETHISQMPEIQNYQAIVSGPGMGSHTDTVKLLHEILINYKGVHVLDADSINILAQNPEFLTLLSPKCILTPHIGEFDRLTHSHTSDFERLKTLGAFCIKYSCHVLLKGAYSCFCSPEGIMYFNCSGNSGMAKAGSGDVLAGLIGGLAAKIGDNLRAGILGMYLHGKAGDMAAIQYTPISMNSSDIIEFIPEVMKDILGDYSKIRTS